MKIIYIDYERGTVHQFKNKIDAKAYAASVGHDWEYLTRYVSDWNMKNDGANEWLEVNCHNSYAMIVPTHALASNTDIFDMIVYWHEQIAFGSFGDESVAMEFDTDELKSEYEQFVKLKWLHENVQTIDELFDDFIDWHNDCDHENDDDEIECTDNQIDQYAYDKQGSFYGMPMIDKYNILAYMKNELLTNDSATIIAEKQR